MAHKAENIILNKGKDDPSLSAKDNRQGHIATLILKAVGIKGNLSSDVHSNKNLWLRIEASVEKRHRRRFITRLACWTAAAIILAVSIPFFWPHLTSSTDVKLELAQIANKNLYLLADTSGVKVKNGKKIQYIKNQSSINFAGEKENYIHNSEAYSTVTVPYGRRTEVILPDRSSVWLSSGSQLTFLKSFNKGEREVFLEGEGFFDVTSDPGHPFHVYSKTLHIKVLGTSFNVCSYREDEKSSTTVMSGKVALFPMCEVSFDEKILTIGKNAQLIKGNNQLIVKEDEGDSQILWKEQQLILKNSPVKEILTKLQRLYNVNIHADEVAVGQTFSGRFDLTQPLEELLATIYDPHQFSIEIKERRVTIQHIS